MEKEKHTFDLNFLHLQKELNYQNIKPQRNQITNYKVYKLQKEVE